MTESRIKCETCRYCEPASNIRQSGPWGCSVSWVATLKCTNSYPHTKDCTPCGQWRSNTSTETFDEVWEEENLEKVEDVLTLKYQCPSCKSVYLDDHDAMECCWDD